jgi:hypothetical protein
MTPVADAPDYGDLKTHDRGHHEYWSGLARLGDTRLRQLGLPTLIATAPYEPIRVGASCSIPAASNTPSMPIAAFSSGHS